GTIQMTGTEMMRIANLNIMEVQAEVSENDILRVQLGNDVNIEVDAYPNKKFKGKVTEISNSSTTAGLESSSASLATDKITNYIVKIIIDQSSYSDLIVPGKGFPFRPGMSASVEITTNIVKDALCVPIQAVTTREIGKDTTNHTNPKADDLKEVVFVPTNDTARMVEVSTGIQDEAYIQVLSGIKPGEKVVAGPYSVVSRTLKSGKKIVVVKKDEINSKSKKPESTED
ncbi:MAG TPA: efflux RND transporter periplasmic adaptor subunit, partial [Saprospiraceae bacterium]|nr:efflux RND transporter periplasmic adaptor subunit [Saprospiraceae bacterium]